MKCPKCDHERWIARQRSRSYVIVDEFNEWEEDLECYDAGHPYGPYTCVGCGYEVEELDDDVEIYMP